MLVSIENIRCTEQKVMEKAMHSLTLLNYNME